MPDGARILYVEDSSDNQILDGRVLQADGYTMLEARTSSEALQQLGHYPVDLTLMDINMPDMDGHRPAASIKAEPLHANLPILAIAAGALRPKLQRLSIAELDGPVVKPIHYVALIQLPPSCLTRAANAP
jgi:two-component system sensor histidine kinase/response regulator